jgi:hypothetical protein
MHGTDREVRARDLDGFHRFKPEVHRHPRLMTSSGESIGRNRASAPTIALLDELVEQYGEIPEKRRYAATASMATWRRLPEAVTRC